MGQSESADIFHFVSELKAKELITGSSVLLSLFQWENINVDLITMGSLILLILSHGPPHPICVYVPVNVLQCRE